MEEGFSTRSVYSAESIDPSTGAIEPPIFLNTAFAYSDVDRWRRAALGEESGHIYSRNTNPTCQRFEQKMAMLEGAEDATSFSTGMAAISATLMSLLSPGQRVVSIKDSYGATYLMFTQILPRFGIHCDLYDPEDQTSLEDAIRRGCALIFVETPTNPTLKIVNLPKILKLGREMGAITVVDNTFATPINQSPIALGADLVLHSATKYVCGHNDVLGGVVCGKRQLIEKIFRFRELTGSCLDAFSAYLLNRSLKTLALRVQWQNESALEIARFLENRHQVERVYYPGLPSHPGHEVAAEQMRAFGGVLSFELKGGWDAVRRFLPALRYGYLAANLGQVETFMGPPSTTSHVETSAVERAAAGIPEGLIRYSVGIEDLLDLLTDLETALALL